MSEWPALERSPGGIFSPLTDNTFRFKCHPGIDCFNRCCAGLRLILTPYDILRLKNRLRLSSGEFLERHTDIDEENPSRFPMVKLRMTRDESRSCPFVTRQGCAVYEDRPGACRLYPLGRASARTPGEERLKEKFFLVREPHCMGFQEEKTWTVSQWLNHEGMPDYNRMNDDWTRIIHSPQSLGSQDNQKKIQMFFMVSYNLDAFRKFLFQSRFFDHFRVEAELQERLAESDTELMKFGFKWLRFSLFGEPTLRIQS